LALRLRADLERGGDPVAGILPALAGDVRIGSAS
jgi:hypothetical protein